MNIDMSHSKYNYILTVTNLQHSVLSIDIYKKTSTPSSC